MKRKKLTFRIKIDVSSYIYKDKKFKRARKFVQEIEKDIGEDLTPSKLYLLIGKDICYDRNLIYTLKRLKCVDYFKFKKEDCVKIIKEFRCYDKILLKNAYDKHICKLCDCYYHVNGIDFFLMCNPIKYKSLSKDYLHKMYILFRSFDEIYEFINHKFLIKSFFGNINYNLSKINILPILTMMNFYIEKTNRINFPIKPKKIDAGLCVLMDFYNEYYSKPFPTNFWKTKSSEYLEIYIKYVESKEMRNEMEWRNKIFERISEDEVIFELFLRKTKIRCYYYDEIYDIIKGNNALLLIFSKFRYRFLESFEEKDIQEMYLKLIKLKAFIFNSNDDEFLMHHVRSDSEILSYIYKHRNPETHSTTIKNIIKKIDLFIFLFRFKNPLKDMNLFGLILSYFN